jgi:hypothetical protein
MTPLDDELRQTLSERAFSLAPAADPLAGVEAKAARIRRTRVALAAGGAALAVAAVAVAVPVLDTGRKGPTTQVATTATPTVSGPASWAYRGNDIPPSTLSTYQREWDLRPPGSTLVPLFGQVYEPSATQELVFVAGDRVGIVQSGEPGPEFLYDEKLASSDVLAFVLPGDEVPRVLAVAAPDASGFFVSSDADMSSAGTPKEPFRPMTQLAPGVAIAPIGAQHPSLQVVANTGSDGASRVEPFDVTRRPGNLLDWGVRGRDPVSPDTKDLRRRFAQALDRPDDATSYSPLYTDQVDGVSFTVGQAWFDGDDQAYTVSYAVASDNVPQFFLGPVTPTNPWGLAFVVDGMQTYQLLVVVPKPGSGQVQYAAHATGSFRPVPDGASYQDGVALIQRDLQASDDRLQTLDGNGDLDHPLFEGRVTPLLCGLKECG